MQSNAGLDKAVEREGRISVESSRKPWNSQHVIVAREQHRHLAFPDACRLSSGEVAVVYREGRAHVDRSGRIMLSKCLDPTTHLSFESPQVVCDTDLDDRDPSIVQLSDGMILVNFFRFDVETWRPQLAIVTSRDGGESWDKPMDLNVPGFRRGLATSDAVIELPSGDLVMAVYGESDDRMNGSFLIRSQDRGKTWPTIVPLAVADSPIFEEPAVARLSDGRLLAFLRTDRQGHGFVYQCVSTDWGFTWSAPERLNLWGYPADALVLADGRVLATYGYRQLPAGVRYCVARPGVTWSIDDEGILRADGHDEGELGYPSSVELQPQDVFTVYYFTDPSGGMPYIAGTRLRIGEGGVP